MTTLSLTAINEMLRAFVTRTSDPGALKLELLANSRDEKSIGRAVSRAVSNVLDFIEKNRTLVELVATGLALSFLYNQLSGSMSKIDRRLALSVKKLLAKKLNRPELEFIELNPYEIKLAEEVVGADEIESGFEVSICNPVPLKVFSFFFSS